jgi:ribosome-binding protein aMBF1 (putative translation factor)
MESTVISYDVALMRKDMAERGMLPTDLAKKAKVADITVSRFLRGIQQNAKTAKRLARALGYKTPKRYVIAGSEAVAS